MEVPLKIEWVWPQYVLAVATLDGTLKRSGRLGMRSMPTFTVMAMMGVVLLLHVCPLIQEAVCIETFYYDYSQECAVCPLSGIESA